MSTHDALRTRLHKRLDQLTRWAGKIAANLRRPQNSDRQERAVESENEVLEHLDATTLEEVGQLEAALGRIDDGTHGTCTRCGTPIARNAFGRRSLHVDVHRLRVVATLTNPPFSYRAVNW